METSGHSSDTFIVCLHVLHIDEMDQNNES